MNKKLIRPTLTTARPAKPDVIPETGGRTERTPRLASGPRARAVIDSAARLKRDKARDEAAGKRDEPVTKADFTKAAGNVGSAGFERKFERKHEARPAPARPTPARYTAGNRSESRASTGVSDNDAGEGSRFEGRRARGTGSDTASSRGERGHDRNQSRRPSGSSVASTPASGAESSFRDKYKKPHSTHSSGAVLPTERPSYTPTPKPRSARSPNSKDFRPALPRAVVASLAASSASENESDSPRAPTRPKPNQDDGTVRLSKLMSSQGIASRREADAWIAKGWVKVDGKVISELGSRIYPNQKITIDRVAELEQQSRVTILLNKPMGYVSGQVEDGHVPASTLFTGENQWEEDDSEVEYFPMQAKGLAPAGRLDIDSIGLIVFTQDGRVAKQLIGEDSDVEKEYLVRVEGTLSNADLKLLNHGLSLDGEALRHATVDWQNEDQLRFVLREGKKRQIRRMCEMVGLTVVGLKRVRIGNIMLGHLPVGKWRYLGAGESFI